MQPEEQDSEGSDLSFQSSKQCSDEDMHPQDEVYQSIQTFKDDMAKFMVANPEFRRASQQFKPLDFISEQAVWQHITKDIFEQQRFMALAPSVEQLSKRINLYRHKIQKMELLQVIAQEQKRLLQQIEAQIVYKKKHQLLFHEIAEAKVRRQTGQLTYFSKCKKEQFQMKVEKAEEKQISRHKKKLVRKAVPKRMIHLRTARNQEQSKQQQRSVERVDKSRKYDKQVDSRVTGFKRQTSYSRKKSLSQSDWQNRERLRERGWSQLNRRRNDKQKDQIKDQKTTQQREREGIRQLQYKSDASRQLIEAVRKLGKDKEEAKKLIVEFIVKQRQRLKEEARTKQSQLLLCSRCYSKQFKQFTLLYPNPSRKKGTLTEEQAREESSANVFQRILEKVGELSYPQLLGHWKIMHEGRAESEQPLPLFPQIKMVHTMTSIIQN